MELKRLWLIFAQAVTVALAVFFVLAALRPQWLFAPNPPPCWHCRPPAWHLHRRQPPPVSPRWLQSARAALRPPWSSITAAHRRAAAAQRSGRFFPACLWLARPTCGRNWVWARASSSRPMVCCSPTTMWSLARRTSRVLSGWYRKARATWWRRPRDRRRGAAHPARQAARDRAGRCATRLQVGDPVLAIGNPFNVPDGHLGHRQRAGPQTSSASTPSRTSSRPMRPSTPATPAARWSTPTAISWHQHRHLFAQRRQPGHRLRDPRQHVRPAGDGRPGARRRSHARLDRRGAARPVRIAGRHLQLAGAPGRADHRRAAPARPATAGQPARLRRGGEGGRQTRDTEPAAQRRVAAQAARHGTVALAATAASKIDLTVTVGHAAEARARQPQARVAGRTTTVAALRRRRSSAGLAPCCDEDHAAQMPAS